LQALIFRASAVERSPRDRRSRRLKQSAMTALCALIFGVTLGCVDSTRDPEMDRADSSASEVVVVPPVLNLSNSRDFDPLKVTDILASELQNFPGIMVIPVNRTLAALTAMNKRSIETPDDAIALAEHFGASACIVMAITEFNPYDPPAVGVVVQWYEAGSRQNVPTIDPTAASREATDFAPAAQELRSRPVWQFQRVYNAVQDDVLDDVRRYASERDEHRSPMDWHIHYKSQELFVRYSCWAALRSIQKERTCDAQGCEKR
jgi:hypothetical protein